MIQKFYISPIQNQPKGFDNGFIGYGQYIAENWYMANNVEAKEKIPIDISEAYNFGGG